MISYNNFNEFPSFGFNKTSLFWGMGIGIGQRLASYIGLQESSAFLCVLSVCVLFCFFETRAVTES